ncbi:sulfotransferase family protein [Thauera sinica]|uniref:Sulfotransferase family protein n=1 Tax=Thauera sinica TaxID=2665146 RepID=A0ABW1AMA2_9RHOO|nr:sulfotransferase [Thauera sp. K11]ATE60916.1 sulfotransferase family protein [Thauera sp. K11]
MSEFLQKVAKTLNHHGDAALRTLRGLSWDVRRPAADRPVIVLGCSRAGTTVVYKTLSESPELGTLQRETHDFWVDLHPLVEKGWDTHALHAADASQRDRNHVARYFYRWTGKNRWVDKNNQNGLCVPYLRTLFPDAIFVYVKRSPGDNINSLIEGWGKPDKYATWSGVFPETVAVDGGRYERWCFFLAEGWRGYLRAPIEEVAAFQYEAINRAILEARGSVPASQWVEVFYEDLVRDPVAGYRKLYADCGLAFTPEVQAHCEQVLSKPYDVFGEIELDKWKKGRNRERVERVLGRVSGVAHDMGYPPA